MKTPRELRARLSRIDGNRPALDPVGDARRIVAMLEPLFGILGCGDEPTGNEKKGGDGETEG